jgi:hypothetical protein
MVIASFDYGVTWDEDSRHDYGIKVWQFVRGLRPRAMFRETGGHVYPGLFDMLCAALETRLDWNRYDLRHVLNATFGWIGIVYCGRLAARMFGPWAGVLAAVLLAASPRYFGASMNNPKDLPFAAMSITALYYISLVSPRWPYVSAGTAAKTVLALALALNIRVGALLYLGYFGLLVIFFMARERLTGWRRLADTGVRLAGVAMAVLLLGTLFWPWAGGAPFTRPFEALLGAAGYPWNGPVLYEGFVFEATKLPWHYAPKWFLISTPLVVLAGAILSLVLPATRREWLVTGGLWMVAALPVVAVILMNSTLYDSHRHLLFVYPVLVVIASGGWAQLLRPEHGIILRIAGATALMAGIVNVVTFDIRSHPHQGVYFNALVGGPAKAYRRFDMDYWGNCIFPAVEWVAATAERFGRPVILAGEPDHLVYENTFRVRGVHFVDETEKRHHMYVELARGSVEFLRDVARKPALHRVTTPDGAVLCTVSAGPAYSDFADARRAPQPPSLPE